jgi:TetR/AcrR family transcriptional regulator, transcriptional repressor for nem operon
MTDSAPADPRRRRAGDKRERLVASAATLMHQRGVGPTTLAEVAQAADVPAGNVFYYFRTKDDLVRAVITAQTEQVEGMLASLESLPHPADRLKALARQWDEMRDVVARYGCPFGTLAAELDRREDGLDLEAAAPLKRLLAWAERQLRELGAADAGELATSLLAGIQGAALLAGALRDPHVMSGQVQRLEHWIDTLTPA